MLPERASCSEGTTLKIAAMPPPPPPPCPAPPCSRFSAPPRPSPAPPGGPLTHDPDPASPLAPVGPESPTPPHPCPSAANPNPSPQGDRWSAQQYLDHWPAAGQLFPPFVRDALHPFLHSLHRCARGRLFFGPAAGCLGLGLVHRGAWLPRVCTCVCTTCARAEGAARARQHAVRVLGGMLCVLRMLRDVCVVKRQGWSPASVMCVTSACPFDARTLVIAWI